MPQNLIGLVASYWHDRDFDTATSALARLVSLEPSFRVAKVMPLPFRDGIVWKQILEGLRATGATE